MRSFKHVFVADISEIQSLADDAKPKSLYLGIDAERIDFAGLYRNLLPKQGMIYPGNYEIVRKLAGPEEPCVNRIPSEFRNTLANLSQAEISDLAMRLWWPEDERGARN